MTDNPFLRLHDNGFRHILPIIPPGATISSASHSLQHRPDDAMGKIPGLKRADGWVGFHGWETYDLQPRDCQDWAGMGAGVGLRCHDVVAVDIDVTHGALADLVMGEVLMHLGFGPVRTGNAPKCLVLFRLAESGSWPTKKKLSFEDWDGCGHAVELLGGRQQFVVDGIHPKTRQPYSWDTHPASDDAGGLDGLTTVTPEELNTFLEAVAELLPVFDCEHVTIGTQRHAMDGRDLEQLRCDDIDLLRDMLRVVPNDEDTDREAFVAVAHACWGATGGEDTGLELFKEWAEKWPYDHNDGEIERVYEGIHHTTLGIQWLSDMARAHGFDNSSADFGDITTAEGAGERDPGAADVEPGGTTETAGDRPEAGDSFWKRWVYVNDVKRFVDLKTNLVLDKEQFDDTFTALGDDEKPHKFFLTHRRPGNWADRVTYEPGNEDRTVYSKGQTLLNRWVAGPAHSGEWAADSPTGDGDIKPWLDLAAHLVPDDRERGLLFDWMAHLLQHPGVKPNWHPLIGSEVHGTGKDSLFLPLVKGLGDGEGGNVSTIRTSDLEGQWTWWAENVQLVVVSEITSFERRSVMQRIKSYMATPPDTIEVNKKGVGQYQVPNKFGMVMFTNSEDAAAIEQHDRRFFVLWSHAEQLEPEWYAQYHDWMGGDEMAGAKAVVNWLFQRDISAFNARGDAPHTQAKENMRRAALPLVEGLVVDGIENEEGPFARDVVTMREIQDWLNLQRVKSMPPPTKLAFMLRCVGALRMGQVRIDGDEGRQTLYVVRRHTMYSDMSMRSLRDRMMDQREKAGVVSTAADFG